jgi:SAM-dependent methyltransferase
MSARAQAGCSVPFEASDAGVRALRELFERCSYSEQVICERFGLTVINDFRTIEDGRSPGEIRDAVDLLVRLFIDSEPVEQGIARSILAEEDLDLLASTGLLRPLPDAPGQVRGTVLLYPTRSLYVASDTPRDPDLKSAPDIVYPALTGNTHRFLTLIPESPCESFLELCGGTGIAALCAARNGARRALSCDITQRATLFAEFNGRLNGLEAFSALAGDLYEPVGTERFDRIAAHPPYIAALSQQYIYRDGGHDGEQITRRIIAGAGEHLKPGGALYLTAIVNEAGGKSVEQRLREMLGEASSEFDVVVVVIVSSDPLEFFFGEARNGRGDFSELERRREILAELQIERMVYASMILRRLESARQPLTLRRQLSPATRWQDIEWLLSIETALASRSAVERLLASRPRATAGIESKLVQKLEGRKWQCVKCEFQTLAPFFLELQAPPWTGVLLERMDGERMVSDHLEFLKQAGFAPPQADGSEFARFIAVLARNGLVQLPEFPWP